MPVTALIVSARMGAGHEGAARELARRLEEQGHRAEIVDFLDAFPAPLSRLWRWFYLFQLRHFPESYESSYQLFYRRPKLWEPFVRFERALAGRRTMRWMEEIRPDVIVSTYSFATLVIGRLKQEGRITVPAVNFLTDFGVHPRAVHPNMDLNLAVHPAAAAAAQRFVHTPVIATGPAIAPSITRDAPSREAARAELGVDLTTRVVLVVSGSWGVGSDFERTVKALVDMGDTTVFTMCGSDDTLRKHLEELKLGTPVGWTERMPAYLSAADVVVENAGGLTANECFARGVPIVSFRAIPGHGRDNVAVMRQAGVTTVPADEAELVAAVRLLSSDSVQRNEQVARASAMFAEDPVDRILQLATGAPGWSEARPAADPR
ncbi:MAG: hypothetical protein JWL70_523 [Acidimicrobiia bacterium]|nr:hypothetical protein [Acidimicrobiia bacterium]